jgi:hypothetical protein
MGGNYFAKGLLFILKKRQYKTENRTAQNDKCAFFFFETKSISKVHYSYYDGSPVLRGVIFRCVTNRNYDC